MNKQLVFFLTILLLIGCGLSNNKKNSKSENVINQDSTSTISKVDNDSINKLMQFREENLNSTYNNYKIYNLKDVINEDFNGDGIVDKAEFKKQKNSGIIITDGKTHKETKLGFGKEFAHLTDFDWVDFGEF